MLHPTFGMCQHCARVTPHTIGNRWNCGAHEKRFSSAAGSFDAAANSARLSAIYGAKYRGIR